MTFLLTVFLNAVLIDLRDGKVFGNPRIRIYAEALPGDLLHDAYNR